MLEKCESPLQSDTLEGEERMNPTGGSFYSQKGPVSGNIIIFTPWKPNGLKPLM